MHLRLPMPGLPFPAEDVHAIGTNLTPGVVIRAPYTISVFRFIQKNTTVQPRQVFRRVNVKDEKSTGL